MKGPGGLKDPEGLAGQCVGSAEQKIAAYVRRIETTNEPLAADPASWTAASRA